MTEQVPIKFCRHCGHVIPQDTAVCPYCERQTLRGPERKECPFCGEIIKGKAIKCKHCGEFLDRRPDRAGERVIHIEKAVIARGPYGTEEVEIYRPDGSKLDREELQLAPGGGARRRLPPGAEQEQNDPHPVRADAELPGPPPAETTPPPESPGEGPPPRPLPEEPLIEEDCPSCGRPVFQGDHFCENCGRDLTREKAPGWLQSRARPYAAADYALMFAATSPLGLLLPGTLAFAPPALAILLAGWSLLRIMLSRGELTGAAKATGAVVLAGFWAMVLATT